jgi:hypothetical protein
MPTVTLSKRVKMIWGLSLHGWEDLMRGSLLVVGVSGLIAGLSTWFVVKLQRAEIAQSAIELTQYKSDAAVKVEEAKKEGVQAGKAAGNALVRAAELEKEAANARLETEKLKGAIAWRIIPPEELAKLQLFVAANPGSVNIQYTEGDPEALYLAMQFFKVFNEAHWNVGFGSLGLVDGIVFGIAIPDNAQSDVKSVRAALSSANIPFGTVIPPSAAARSSGTKVNGPLLMIGSKITAYSVTPISTGSQKSDQK